MSTCCALKLIKVSHLHVKQTVYFCHPLLKEHFLNMIYSLVTVNIFAGSRPCPDCLHVLISNHTLSERKDREVKLMTDGGR